MSKPTPQEAQALLVARLRSGTVRQTQGILGNRDGERCCLGVACDIAVEHGVIPAPVEDKKTGHLLYGIEEEATYKNLPKTVQKFFGFSNSTGIYDNVMPSLAESNDTGRTFSAIADTIESRPFGLFVS